MNRTFPVALHSQLDRFLAKSAGIQQDMANRIMYSLLPGLADPAQVASTQGVVDYKALRLAVEGRHKLITYGTQAVASEMNSCNSPAAKDKFARLWRAGQLEEAMDEAVNAFQNADWWPFGYGGFLWQKIAQTLRQLIRLDKTLTQMRANPDDKDADTEVQLMRDVVVQMNVFDGLAHNADSIMRNLVNLETWHDPDTEYKQVRRLMDAKELESPQEVFRVIEPTLQGSGDIHKFKDWASKLRQNREFNLSNRKDIVEELFLIFMRKALLPLRSSLNKKRDELGNKLKMIEAEFNKHHDLLEAFYLLSHAVETQGHELRFDLNTVHHSIHDRIYDFLEQYPEFRPQIPTLKAMLTPIASKARDHHTKIRNILEEITKNEHKDEATLMHHLERCKEALNLAAQISWQLDTI